MHPCLVAQAAHFLERLTGQRQMYLWSLGGKLGLKRHASGVKALKLLVEIVVHHSMATEAILLNVILATRKVILE